MTKFCKNGIAVGRFQLIHIYHESMINAGRALCEHMYILIGSAQESGTERNPFKYETREALIKAIYKDGKSVIPFPLEDLKDESNNNPAWGDYLFENCVKLFGSEPDLMVYGNDDSRSNWFSKNKIYNTTELIVDRHKTNFSATYLRLLLLMDIEEEWKKHTNILIHNHYNTLREELLAIEYYTNLLEQINTYIPNFKYLIYQVQIPLLLNLVSGLDYNPEQVYILSQELTLPTAQVGRDKNFHKDMCRDCGVKNI